MRSIATVVAVVSAASIGVGAHAVLAGSARTHHATRTVIITCQNHGVQHPSNYVLACADGNAELNNMQWRHWASASASAKATLHLNLCQPDCASGTFRNFPVNVTVDHRALTAGRRVYRRLSYTIIGHLPHGVLRHVVYPLPA